MMVDFSKTMTYAKGCGEGATFPTNILGGSQTLKTTRYRNSSGCGSGSQVLAKNEELLDNFT